jgi:hypothetical protein
MTDRIMGDKELVHLEVMRDLDAQRITAQAAAAIHGVGRPPGATPAEGRSQCWRRRLDLQEARPNEQP